MPALEFRGETYRYARMSAWEQGRALEVMQPVAAALREVRDESDEARMARYGEAVLRCAHDLSEEKIAALLRATLGRAERRIAVEPEEWAPIWDTEADDAIGDDLDGMTAVWLALSVARASLARFLAHEPIKFTPAQHDAPACDFVEMPGNLRWMMTPVVRGVIRYESLHDGSIDLADIALINDVLVVEAENQARLQNAMRKG